MMIERLLSPKVVFGALFALIVLTIICTPAIDTGEEQPHLTSFSNDERGARGLYLVAEELGWTVSRRTAPMRSALDTNAIYVVLAPVTGFTATEVNRLLEAVRGGAGLLYSPFGNSPLSDSLGIELVRPSFRGYAAPAAPPPRASVDYGRYADMYDGVPRRALRLKGPVHDDTRIFVQAADAVGDSIDLPVVVGLPFGRGWLAVVADPALLRNDFIRDDEYALLPIRLLEWLSPGGRRPIVFDEFHQGFGEHPNLARAVLRLLTKTPPGRALAVLAIALLLLLIAAATRAIPPRPLRRVERRSPLEHVGALARAYEQVRATRVAARRLVHGLRRRHATGSARGLDDEAYLRAIAARHPHLAADVSRTQEALRHEVSPAGLLAVGQAIDHIDRTLGT